MATELVEPPQLVSDGPGRQEAQIRQSQRWLTQNHTVKMVGAAVPRVSLWGLLFCAGWIACNASYQVRRVPELQAKAQTLATVERKVLPKLQVQLKKEKAGKAQAERQVKELVNIVVAQGVLEPEPLPRPTPKPR